MQSFSVEKHQRNFSLDLVRATAILLVCGIHVIQLTYSKDIYIFWYLAYFGVEIFFVLSGYLIGDLIMRIYDPKTNKADCKKLLIFISRRWLRTLPAYFLVLALSLTFSKYIFKVKTDFDYSYLSFTTFFFKNTKHFFGEVWSLCIEEWFYVAFPLFYSIALFCSSNLKVNYIKKTIGILILFIVSINFLRYYYFDSQYPIYNVTIMRLDAIAYGFLIRIIGEYFSNFFKSWRWGVAGIILSCSAIIIFLKIGKSELSNLIYYPLIGIGIGLILLQTHLIAFHKIPEDIKRSIKFISQISYSMYLLNLLIIQLLNYFAQNKYYGFLPYSIFVFSVIIIVSYLLYTFIEKPILDFRDNYFKLPPKSSIIL